MAPIIFTVAPSVPTGRTHEEFLPTALSAEADVILGSSLLTLETSAPTIAFGDAERIAATEALLALVDEWLEIDESVMAAAI